MEYGLLSLIVLVLNVVAIINILGTKVPGREKFLWILVILMLPILGLILWMAIAKK